MTLTPSQRRPALAGLGLLALLLLALWSFRSLSDRRAEAAAAAADLALCQQLEDVITAMRRQTTLVSAQDLASQELGQRIDAAAREAGLAPNALQGVIPLPTQPLGNLPYVEKPTTISLRNVELRPTTAFLYNLTTTPGLTVRSLRLQAPRGETAANLWDINATISCLIYSPNANVRGEQ